MSDVRPLERDDIPRIANLRRRIFEQSRNATNASLEDYYRITFLEHPWATPGVSSLVLDGENDVLGFIGVLPRPLQLGSERLVSITTVWTGLRWWMVVGPVRPRDGERQSSTVLAKLVA